MLSVKLNGDHLELRFEVFMGPKEFAYANHCLGHMEGAYRRDDNVWVLPKERVDELDATFKDNLAWHNSIEDIKGIRQVVLPKFHSTLEGLEDMKLPPRPFQAVGISFLHDIEQGLLADEMGLGKAQPLDAKILTPDGFILMGDIKVGDEVIGSDGKPTKVIGVFPQGEKDIYKVTFSDGSSTECCDEHLWAVNTTTRRYRKNPYLVKELKDIKDDLRLKSGNAKYFIPMVEAVDFEYQDLPIHPYLMGYLLGNGSFRDHTTMVTIPDQETVDYIKTLLPYGTQLSQKTDIDYRIAISSDEWKNNIVKGYLKEMGLYGKYSDEKHIPECYKLTEIADRILLLQGLLDSDGHVRPADNNIEFSSSSKELAEGVQFIVQSLGGTAPIRKKETTHKPAYRMSIALPKHIKPFCLSRKADVYHPRAKYPPSRAMISVEYVGKKHAQCIRVEAEDQLYVTDNFIVTHNTPQAIGAVHRLVKEGKVRKALVICPTSLKYQWGDPKEGEINKFTDYQAVVIDGLPKQRQEQYLRWITDDHILFGIVNYELVRNDLELIKKLPIDVIIADEVHRIKNWASKTSQALKELYAPYKFGLTGTPMQNKPEELFNLFDFLNPAVLGNFWAFKKRYLVTGEKFGQRNVVIGYRNLDELRRRVGPYMLRRMKKEVAPELPEMVINDYLVEMTLEQYKLNEELRADLMDLLKDIQEFNSGKDALDENAAKHPKEGQSFGYFTMMQEVSDSLELLRLSDSNMAQRYTEGLPKKLRSPKLDEIEEIVRDQMENGNNKIVIFTQFARMQRLIVERLEKIGKCEILNGSMKPVDRQAAVDRFKYQEDIHFFVTTDAGNYGINLQFASVLIHVDLPWNPAIYDQRCGRIHRIGSAFKEVTIINLITKGGLDEQIQQVLYKKRELSNQIVEKSDMEKAEMNRLTVGMMKQLLKKPAKKKKGGKNE